MIAVPKIVLIILLIFVVWYAVRWFNRAPPTVVRRRPNPSPRPQPAVATQRPADDAGHVGGVVAEDGFLGVIPLPQAHAAAAADVDRGIDQHSCELPILRPAAGKFLGVHRVGTGNCEQAGARLQEAGTEDESRPRPDSFFVFGVPGVSVPERVRTKENESERKKTSPNETAPRRVVADA